MSSHSKPLVGREFRAMIGEPWDFASDAGENVLEGQIIELSTSIDPCEWIRCKIIPFMAGNTSVFEVALVRRYVDSNSIAAQLETGKDVGANIVYDPRHGILPAYELREALRKKVGLSFLVGSVKLL
ncbi:MAG: hypothetical protein AB1648_13920 [Pseudomonadota bacterium]